VTADFEADTYQRRRERFLDGIGGGVAILVALPELVKSRDTSVRYRPDSDLFYLTGFAEPGAVAVLTPHDEEHRCPRRTLTARPPGAPRDRLSPCAS